MKQAIRTQHIEFEYVINDEYILVVSGGVFVTEDDKFLLDIKSVREKDTGEILTDEETVHFINTNGDTLSAWAKINASDILAKQKPTEN